MPKRPKQESEYASLAIRVDGYESSIGSGVNLDLLSGHPTWSETSDPVETNEIEIDVFGVCTHPPERAHARFEIHFRHSTGYRRVPTLKDAHVHNKHDVPVYRKTRYGSLPLYAVPPGIAVLHKRRGVSCWDANLLQLNPETLASMLTLFALGRQLYLSIYEHKVDRKRWVRQVSLQTRDPAAD